MIENEDIAYLWNNLVGFYPKLKYTWCEITSSLYVLRWKVSYDVTSLYDVDVSKLNQ